MSTKKKSGNPVVDFLAGGIAGCCEALSCHPLDTIKVRMQLNSKAIVQARTQPAVGAVAAAAAGSGTASAAATAAAVPPTLADAARNVSAPAKAAAAALPPKRGFAATGLHIARTSGIKGLYRGIGAVIAGITPKMAVRFWSFEELKRLMTPAGQQVSTMAIFLAGLGAGTIEAVLVVNPSDVVKIRLQAQTHSLMEPGQQPKYRNALHCIYTMIKEEGIGSIYRGVVLTAARQATNQGTNFTVYTLLKAKLVEVQPDYNGVLPGWQTSLIGLTSGALGPLSNAPLDTIKTRMQRERKQPNESGLGQFMRIARDLVRTEGPSALYRGITPRIMRVAPGQAVTFTVYEFARRSLEAIPVFSPKPLQS